MKKRLLILLFAGLIMTAAGCSGKNADNSSVSSAENENADTTAEAKGSTEIVYSNDYVDLADYKNISAQKNLYTVTDDAVEEEIQSTLAEYADYNEVDRASKEGDYVTILFSGSIGDEQVLDYSSEDDAYEIIIGDEEYGAEFDEKLTGVKTGDTLDFSIAYTEENATEENGLSDFAGSTVDYHVEVTAISEEILPEYTDEFVAENLDYDNKESFEKSLRTSLEEEYQDTSDSELKESLIDVVIQNSKIKEYPDELYDSYYDAVKADYDNYAEMFGMSSDELLESFGMTDEDIKSEALEYLHRYLIVSAIAENENLSVSDDEFDAGVAEYVDAYEYEDNDSFLEDYGEDNVREWLLEDKVLNLLVENADISEVTAEYETE